MMLRKLFNCRLENRYIYVVVNTFLFVWFKMYFRKVTHNLNRYKMPRNLIFTKLNVEIDILRTINYSLKFTQVSNCL